MRPDEIQRDRSYITARGTIYRVHDINDNSVRYSIEGRTGVTWRADLDYFAKAMAREHTEGE